MYSELATVLKKTVWLETTNGITEQQEVRKEGSLRNIKEIAETDQNGLIATRSQM